MNNILEAKEISKHYSSGKNQVKALKNNSFTIEAGKIIVIVGRSGSGKSTLLNIIGGLMPPDTGQVLLTGQSVYDINETKRTQLRMRKIGFIFQNFNLINELSVINNIRLPFDISRQKYNVDIENEIFEMLNINDRLSFYPDQLSGGEQQRVAIARALLMNPDIILADEPTGNLDSESGNSLMQFVQNNNQHQKQTYVIVTHDLAWTSIANDIYYMSDGILKKESE